MDILLQRGVDAARAGRPHEAADCFSKVLAADGGNITARAWLGQALCASRRQKEGTEQLREAAAQLLDLDDINRVPHVIEIVVQLQQLAELSSALSLCERLASSYPNNAKAHRLLAMCLHQFNRPAEALKACQAAAELGPADPMAEVFQASIELENSMMEVAKNRLDAVLSTLAPPIVHFRAHKEAARGLEMGGAYNDAFEHLLQAERCSRQVPEFQRIDLNLIPSRVAANSRAFTAHDMNRWAGTAFDDRGTPIFIVGFYRSGTTLVQEVLDAHPSCFVADEAPLIQEALRELALLRPGAGDVQSKLATLDLHEVQRLRHAYWEAAQGRYGSAVDRRVFVDKFTLNTVDLGFINTVFPDAKVIFLVRDPRDVCLSGYMQLMPPTAATAHLLAWERAAAFYATVMDWWLLVRERLTLPWIEIRYEDAVADFRGTFENLLGFLELAWDDALLTFHERAAKKFVGSPSRHQVAQPLYTTAVARWRRYERHFAPVQDRLAPFVERFGYPQA